MTWITEVSDASLVAGSKRILSQAGVTIPGSNPTWPGGSQGAQPQNTQAAASQQLHTLNSLPVFGAKHEAPQQAAEAVSASQMHAMTVTTEADGATLRTELATTTVAVQTKGQEKSVRTEAHQTETVPVDDLGSQTSLETTLSEGADVWLTSQQQSQQHQAPNTSTHDIAPQHQQLHESDLLSSLLHDGDISPVPGTALAAQPPVDVAGDAAAPLIVSAPHQSEFPNPAAPVSKPGTLLAALMASGSGDDTDSESNNGGLLGLPADTTTTVAPVAEDATTFVPDSEAHSSSPEQAYGALPPVVHRKQSVQPLGAVASSEPSVGVHRANHSLQVLNRVPPASKAGSVSMELPIAHTGVRASGAAHTGTSGSAAAKLPGGMQGSLGYMLRCQLLKALMACIIGEPRVVTDAQSVTANNVVVQCLRQGCQAPEHAPPYATPDTIGLCCQCIPPAP